MGAVSCPAVCRFGACGGHVPTLCLRCTRSFLGVAWRSSSVAFLLVPLPPSAFFLIYLFSYLFFRGFVHFTFTGLLASVWRVVGLWVFFRLRVYCGCSPLAHGHPTSTCDTGVNTVWTYFSCQTGQAVASRVALVDRLNPQKQPTKKVCGNTTQYLSILIFWVKGGGGAEHIVHSSVFSLDMTMPPGKNWICL